MLRLIMCARCSTRQTISFRTAAGRKIRCRSCGHELPPAALEDLLRMQGLMRMGDDEGGGGGDWGGGGGDDDGADAGDDEDDDDEEDDGKSKKKKPAKKKGFVASIVGGAISRLIGMAIAAVLVVGCCCFIGVWGVLFGFPPAFSGEWEAQVAQASVKDKNKSDSKDGKEKTDKEKTGADKKGKDKVDNDPDDSDEPVFVTIKLKFNAEAKAKSGTGTYINEHGKTLTFKWSDLDDANKTFILELDGKDETFWNDIKSPTKFTFNVTGNTLTLTAGSASQTFERPMSDAKPAQTKKPGGKKRR